MDEAKTAQTCLDELKLLMSNDSDLNYLKFEDEFLLRFIRGRKYNTHATFKTIQHYCWVRREKYCDLFKKLKPSEGKNALESGVVGFLKYSDCQGRRVFYARSEPWDVNKYHVEDMLLASILLTDEAIKSEEIQEKGIVVIFDYNKFTFKQMMSLSISQTRKVVNILLNGTPFKVKQMHCVNVSRLFYWSHSILTHLTPQKLKQRILVHQDLKTFQDHMNVEFLPKWLGGPLSHEESTDLEMMERIYGNEFLYGNESPYTLQSSPHA